MRRLVKFTFAKLRYRYQKPGCSDFNKGLEAAIMWLDHEADMSLKAADYDLNKVDKSYFFYKKAVAKIRDLSTSSPTR